MCNSIILGINLFVGRDKRDDHMAIFRDNNLQFTRVGEIEGMPQTLVRGGSQESVGVKEAVTHSIGDKAPEVATSFSKAETTMEQ